MISSPAVPVPENGTLPGFATVCLHHNGEKCLIADAFVPAGTIICSFGAKETLASPTYLTLQVGQHKHILLTPEVLQYINHSCDPNVFFDTTLMQLRAVKDILPGDEFRFFYPSTEWDMDRSFVCNCQSSACLGIIQGARHLQTEILNRYKLTDFIKSQIETIGVSHE